MSFPRPFVRLSILFLALAACQPDRTGPNDRSPVAESPELAISDALHSGGNQHFYFLPPLVPQPQATGTFDGSLDPIVEICEWNQVCGTVIARFVRRQPGEPGRGLGNQDDDADDAEGRFLVKKAGVHYLVNWNTKQCLSGSCTLDPAKTYRIRVLVGAVELGFADVDLVNNRAEVRNVQTNEYIPLVNGASLPLKFRIETGAVSVLAQTGGSATISAAAGGRIATADGSVALVIPPGALAGSTSISVAPALDAPEGTGPWAQPVELGPDGQTFSTPVTLTLGFKPENLPPGVLSSGLGVFLSDGTGWELVDGGVVDEVSNTISVPIQHFSTYWVGIRPTTVNWTPTPTTIQVGQQTQFTGSAWGYTTYVGQHCYWVRSFWSWRYVCQTYVNSYSFPVKNVAVYWYGSDPTVATVPPGPTYTNATGDAPSTTITGIGVGSSNIRATAAGFSTSSTVTLTVLGRLGLLPKVADVVAGWSVGQQLTRTPGGAAPLSVSLTNKNGFLVVAEPGTANYTYGGQTGTYVIAGGATLKQLVIAGLAGVGVDTLIATAAGFVPDTAVITLVQGKFLVSGLPATLNYGDSAAVQVTVASQAGALGNLGYPISVGLASGGGLVFSNGTAAITTIGIQQRTSPTFYVKAVAAGPDTLRLSHPDYLLGGFPVSVGNPPKLAIEPWGSPPATDFRKIGFGQGIGAWIRIPAVRTTPLSVSISHTNPAVASSNGGATVQVGLVTEGVTIGAGTIAGRDTMIVQAAGYAPDSLVIESGMGYISVDVLPATLAFGDSVRIRLHPVNPDNQIIDNAWGTTFQLSSNGMLAFSDGSQAITGARVPDGTSSSASFWVKAIGVGQAQFIASHPLYHTSTTVVTITPPLFSLASLDASSGYTCGTTVTNAAYCWGSNSNEGVLGNGIRTGNYATPQPVTGGLAFATISADGGHTCALTTAGLGYCWGYGSDTRLGTGIDAGSYVPVAIAGGRSYTQIDVGSAHACALGTDQQAYCWGHGIVGQLANTGNPNARGNNSVPTLALGGLHYIKVAAGNAFTCGIATDNTAYCWGFNTVGQLGAPSPTTYNCDPYACSLLPTPVTGGLQFRDISAGGQHACGITTTAEVWCWGGNGDGQLGNGTTTNSIAPVRVMGIPSDPSQIDVGGGHSCVRTVTGQAYCWGANAFGQLGNGTQTGSGTPVAVSGGLSFLRVTTGASHSCGLTAAGEGYCWGANSVGEVGMGAFSTPKTVPNRVVSP